MTTQSQSTVGTVVYLVDRTTTPPTIIAVPALKGLSTVGGGKNTKVDISNMDSKAFNESQSGRIDPGEASGELILIKKLPGHQKIKALQVACADGTIDGVDVFVGDSDGNAPPTLGLTPNFELIPPTDGDDKWSRSGTIGRGYISNFSPKKEDNNVDRADFAIQWTGGYQWVVKGEDNTEFH